MCDSAFRSAWFFWRAMKIAAIEVSTEVMFDIVSDTHDDQIGLSYQT